MKLAVKWLYISLPGPLQLKQAWHHFVKLSQLYALTLHISLPLLILFWEITGMAKWLEAQTYNLEVQGSSLPQRVAGFVAQLCQCFTSLPGLANYIQVVSPAPSGILKFILFFFRMMKGHLVKLC